MPVTLIGESVFARCLSALKEERMRASATLSGPKQIDVTAEQKKDFVENVRRALYCSKIISYAQGYMLLRAADEERNWNLNMGAIALLWSGGCIIRSVFLGDIKKAFAKNAKLENMLVDDFFSTAINKYQMSWRKAQIHAIELGIPAPAFSTALAFYDGYRTKRLAATI
jgi:6-phosphogluconate dehydrogenase